MVSTKTEIMLRLSIVRNFNFLSKSLPLHSSLVTNFAKNLNQPLSFNVYRHISLTTPRFCDTNEEKKGGEEASESGGYDITKHILYKKFAGTPRDRTKIIPYETSIEYIKSAAFKSTYGDKKVWELYRRVHKGQLPKKKTRRNCINHGVIAFGSPCPVCRDEYLVLDYRNLELLKHFISEYTGEVFHILAHSTFTGGLFHSKSYILFVCKFCRFFHMKKRVCVKDSTHDYW